MGYIYPSSIASTTSGDYTSTTTVVTFPKYQTNNLSENSLTNQNYMVAFARNTNSDQGVQLNFKNLCSIIRIPVTTSRTGDAAKLTKIEVTSNVNISGKATIGLDDNNPTNITFTNGEKSIVMNCGDVNVREQKDFYIMLPAGTHNISVKFYDATGKYMEGKLNNVELIRSHIHSLNVVSLNADKEDSWLPGKFSVSETDTVYFSPGNLQWSANNGGSTATTHVTADGTAAGTWRFAEYQYSYVGDGSKGNVYYDKNGTSTKCNNVDIAETYAGWIDLFGWATSGYNGKQPWFSSESTSKYFTSQNIVGNYAKYDWGVFNAIVNIKSNTTDAPGTWRLLTKAEQVFLFKDRSCANRFARAKINNVNGILVFPDGYNNNVTISNITGVATINSATASYPSENIDASTWENMEKAGVVFLPSGARRTGKTLYNVNDYGGYYTSTRSNGEFCFRLRVTTNGIEFAYADDYFDGFHVRLVKDI